MNDQKQKLEDTSTPYIVLSGDNGTVVNEETINHITSRQYRAVFMSPEIVFENKHVKALWRDIHWREQLLAIVVDEVHCVEKWGKKFRPHYARLGELRALTPGVPFVGLTATLTGMALEQTKDKLFLSKAQVIQVTDVRTNIRLEETRPDLQAKIETYHSTRDDRYRARAMNRFIKNEVHVLLATEAAGMGCDVPDVVQVIQYG
ncbi:TNF receptor-associated protein 1, mitochondrial [Podila clonocystis]|nr:TNF receptor-associated protein 1, mitochondrial [Podila clonocystis]